MKIVKEKQLKDFKDQEVIFTEGELGDCAYLVEKGTVLIYLTQNENEIPLKHLGEGEVFGEMSLIDFQPRSASCKGIGEGRLIVVTKNQLFDRIRTTDPIVKMLMKVLLERLREQNQRIGGQKLNLVKANHPLEIEKKEAIERIGLEHRIAIGVDQDEFVPFYQPIMCLKTNKIVGCEALIRWQSKNHGLISPSEFMDVMEESSSILSVGKIIIEKSLSALVQLQRHSSNPDFFISINISGRQFSDFNFLNHLESVRKKLNLASANIKLELTERIMTTGHQAIETLQKCRDKGYKLAIDDFGTGFSSLQYLAQMPLTDLKIDRSFVSRMLSEEKSMSVIKSLISLGQNLGLNLIAEGIENSKELNCLQKMNVPMGQGFYFSKAVSLHEFLSADYNLDLKSAA
jgi:EAL domain-containing protein (putative c-di-GMP-specific phosphodiesterase class I)